MYRIQCTFFSPKTPPTYVGSTYMMKEMSLRNPAKYSPTYQGKSIFLSQFFPKSKNQECINPVARIKIGAIYAVFFIGEISKIHSQSTKLVVYEDKVGTFILILFLSCRRHNDVSLFDAFALHISPFRLPLCKIALHVCRLLLLVVVIRFATDV